jgi:class 3 adenylate cyclase
VRDTSLLLSVSRLQSAASTVRHAMSAFTTFPAASTGVREAGRLPGGLVTFMFTDLEGSTRLLQRLGADAYREALERHRVLLRERVRHNGGVEFGAVGDALFAAFADPAAALRASAEIQRALAAEAWPASTRFAVRIGLHRGPAEPRQGTYVAIAVHEAARIAASGHGGQVVVSAAVRAATSPEHDGLRLVNLGQHMLKDFDDPVELHQLDGPGLERDFPALSTPRGRYHMRPAAGPGTRSTVAVAARRRLRRSRSVPCCHASSP